MTETEADGYRAAADTALCAARAAGEVIVPWCDRERREHWEKSHDSPVTQADLEANRAILDVLRGAYPDDAILSEETVDSAARLDASRVWIVDPLDGTKEFIEGVPQFSVSVALCVDGQPVAGCVYQPLDREGFRAWKGGGAWLDDRRLSISSAAALDECVCLSSRTEMKRGQMDPYRDLFRKIEPVGSVALKLAWVSAQRGDVWISAAPKSEWDVCAGDLLVREAGGRFVCVDSGERRYNQPDVLLRPLMVAGPAARVDEICSRSREP